MYIVQLFHVSLLLVWAFSDVSRALVHTHMFICACAKETKSIRWWLLLPLQNLLHAVSPTLDISVVVTADFLMCVRVCD